VVNESILYAGLAEAPVNLVATMLATGGGVLKKALAQAHKQGVEAKTILVESAERDVAGPIVAQARKQRADLIVLGTHGRRGMRRLVLGSDAAHVVATTKVPVLLVRSPG
jgi:nucleotide-binding universal stress UspA family protein